MQEDEIEIYYLLIKQHYSQVTLEEKAEIERILTRSERAHQLANEIKQIPLEEAKAYLRDLDLNEAYIKILQAKEIQSGKRRRIKIAWATSSAAILVVALSIWFVLNPPSTHTKKHHFKEIQGATLQLADGRTILMIDSGQQSINAGIANVNNSNRVLNFTPALNDGRFSSNGWNTLTVPVKSDYQVILEDGTTVWINSASKLRFPFYFTGKSRDIYLEAGEAYFKVAPNANTPFIVHTPNGVIKVLGTEFNINCYTNDQITTSLVSGKVEVISGPNKKELTPGKEATVNTANQIELQDFDITRQGNWRTGILYFKDVSIIDVKAILQRWFDVQVYIDNPSVSSLKFQGSINRNAPLQDFITQMNQTGIMTFYWKGNELHCK